MSEGTPRVVAVDVGGTFTDVITIDPRGVRSWKVPTSAPQSDAVLAVLEEVGLESTLFLHGTTVATNALLEESGANVALITSAGFEDVVEIARQKRASLYDNSVDRPPPLVDRARRFGHAAGANVIEEIAGAGAEAVAVALLGSFRSQDEELTVASQIADRLPSVPISIGSRVSPGFREYERIESTVIEAYLRPVVGRYLQTLDGGATPAGSFVMSSSGGLLPLTGASEAVGQLTLSGPAAGVVAVEALCQYHGLESAIAFDMGGTSTDVCRIDSGIASVANSQQIGGRINRIPSVPIHTVGAGGGSIAWVDSGGSLRVGPRSAGADPGPAGYGLGGKEPTVTDANLVLGHIPADAPLSGGLRLDWALAEDALGGLGAVLGMEAAEVAAGIVEVVDAHMERAIRVVSVEEGFDPRNSVLVAYGGAGGLHASRLARRLQVRSVFIPPYAGAFSAVGLALAKPRHEVLRTLLCGPDEPILAESVSQLVDEVQGGFEELHSEQPDAIDVVIEGRFVGQAHEITVPYRADSVAMDISDAHERRFGFTIDDDVEVVNVRAIASGRAPLAWPIGSSTVAANTSPPALPGPGRHSEGLAVGSSHTGPLTIVDDLSTTLVAADETLTMLDDGTLEITW